MKLHRNTLGVGWPGPVIELVGDAFTDMAQERIEPELVIEPSSELVESVASSTGASTGTSSTGTARGPGASW